MKQKLLLLMFISLFYSFGNISAQNPSIDFRLMEAGGEIGVQQADKSYPFDGMKIYRISGSTLKIEYRSDTGSNGFKAEGSGFILQPDIDIKSVKVIGSSSAGAGVNFLSAQVSQTAYNNNFEDRNYTTSGVTAFIKAEDELIIDIEVAAGEYVKLLWGSNVFIHYLEIVPASSDESPSISSLKVNNENVEIADEMSFDLPYAYFQSSVDIEFRVNPNAKVDIDGNEVENNDGIVFYNSSSPELVTGASIAMAINVLLEEELKSYLLEVVRNEPISATIGDEEVIKIWDFTNWDEETLNAFSQNWIVDENLLFILQM